MESEVAVVMSPQSVVQSDGEGLYIRERMAGKEICRRLKAKDPAAAEMEARKILADWRSKLKNLWLRNGVWYLAAVVRGRRIYQSLQSAEADVEGAQRKARMLLGAARDQRWDAIDKTKLRRGFATIGETLRIYAQNAPAHGVGPNTVRNYRSSLRQVVGVASDSALEALSTEELSRETIRKYVALKLAAGDGISPRRSIKSTVKQARAFFGRQWALEAYEDAGLKLPNLDGFRKSFIVEADPYQYELPPKDLIDATHAAATKLKDERPDLWPVYLLAYYLGMRAGEIEAARWTWLTQDPDGRWWMSVIKRPGEWKGPKATEGRVPVPTQVKTWLDEVRAATPSREYILAGDYPTHRHVLIGDTFAAWMRGLGWTTVKAAHELRKLRGSEWYTKRGLAVACAWLRHQDPVTTTRFYARLSAQPPTLEVGE